MGAQGASASYTRGLVRTLEVRRKGGQGLVMLDHGHPRRF